MNRPENATDNSEATTPAVVIDGVEVRIGEAELLSGVTATANAGELTGLIGPNGAGKSTLLSVISGDVAPSAGTVRLLGEDPNETGAKRLARVRSVMLQDVAVSFAFLVRDVVEMGRRPWSNTTLAEEDDAVVDAALEATGVEHLAARDIMTLSGGERARVALARVLAQQTPVVLLDEPTAALDIRHQEQAMGLARAMARAGAAVIVVLHDLAAAAAYCDRVICLADGRVAAAGDVAEVYRSEVLSEVYRWPITVSHTDDGEVTVRPTRSGGEGYRHRLGERTRA